MIDMKFAHKIARHTIRWTVGVTYREALSSAMRTLWNEFKKATTTAEQAITRLTSKELTEELYKGYKADGYSIDQADSNSREVAAFVQEGRWESLAVKYLKLAGWGSAV